MITLKKVLASIALVFLSINATATEIPFAKRINFVSVEAYRSSTDSQYDLIEVVGVIKYGNACKASDYKIKTLNQNGNKFYYDVFGADGDNYSCPKIYLPVEQTYVIDRIKISREMSVVIKVNGAVVE